MAKAKVTLRTEKVFTNKLLKRKQFHIAISHPKRTGLSKEEIKTRIATAMKVQNPSTIFIFGGKSSFGGGKSSAFGLVYDDIQAAKKFEKKTRLVKAGLAKKVSQSRKQIKDRKNRAYRLRGADRVKILYPKSA